MEPTRLALSRWLTTRALGIVTALAFLSYWSQAEGLIGDQGILPFSYWLEAVGEQLGDNAVWRVPTVLWAWPEMAGFHVVAGLGLLSALALAIGVPFEGALVATCWVCYLSISLVGQRFLSFQWDTLLTETLFTAMFFVRWSPWSSREPGLVATWLMRLLLFKLMLLSGLVKMASGDPTWWDGTAMTFHYWTQPLPNPASWYVDALPVAFHKLETWATLGIELVLPFAMFAGRPGRLGAAAGFALVLVILMLTGNYGFFQLLTLVLCIPLVHDDAWRVVLPERFVAFTERYATPSEPGIATELILAPLAVMIVGLGALYGAQRLDLKPPEVPYAAELRAFRSVNAYGLFAVMTKERPEVVLEVSNDGKVWHEWHTKYKPGALDVRPAIAGPHMPRLDWQLWFAALSNCKRNRWVQSLQQQLLEDESSVHALMGERPIDAPTMARSVRYRYTLAPAESKDWWERKRVGSYCPTMRR